MLFFDFLQNISSVIPENEPVGEFIWNPSIPCLFGVVVGQKACRAYSGTNKKKLDSRLRGNEKAGVLHAPC